MKSHRRWVLGAFIVITLVASVLGFFQRPIGNILMRQLAQERVGRNILDELPDGMHLALCGTGSPLPDPSRAGPCSAIIVGRKVYIVDAGEGGARNLAFMGIPAANIEAIFLTHFHSDHIDGLGPFLLQRWAGATAQTPLPVYGPRGVDEVVNGLRAAYTLDFGYRIAHHSEKILPAGGSGGIGKPFDLPPNGMGDQVVVLELDGLKVTAFRVNHAPVEPAVGYRFDYQGRSIVLSGDTTPVASLVQAAKGADILVHEALQPNLLVHIRDQLDARKMGSLAHVMRDIITYHTTPEQAAQQAAAAGVKQLILNHIVPPLPFKFAYPAFLGDAADYYKGPITVGEDGMLFSLTGEGGKSNFKRLL